VGPDVPVVVCTARLVRRKGQDTLVEAWPGVVRRRPDAVLLLVGDGPDRRRLERLARARGVAGSVRFTGSVPWREVPAYTDAGDVFAMPCRTRRLGLEPEAWGIVFLEAQACGLPVVVGRSGGAPETIVGTGTTVGSVAETAQALLAFLGPSGRVERRPLSEDRRREVAWERSSRVLADLLGEDGLRGCPSSRRCPARR
jgi:phosphatidylinositol alpha-1,6-mannosyltransferase